MSVVLFRHGCRCVNVVLSAPFRRYVSVTKRFENTRIQRSWATMSRFHLQEQLSPPSTCDMKRLVAVFVAALYAGTHFLVAYIADLSMKLVEHNYITL